MDETNAYYAEQVLSNRNTLEKLIEAEPTLKDKILSFFKGAEADYADVPKLSGAAKRYYRTYKKLFDEFSARNAQSNSSENAHLSTLFEKNSQKTPLTNINQEDMSVSGRDYAFKGVAEDGKSKYESNFQKGTPKAAKSERILDYITNVWSKKPISLVISNGETSRTITAQFDPTLDPSGNMPTDASKIAGGNRHGTSSEKRVTLDLADDYYQIASEAKYNYSKEETGKTTGPHKDVKMWHYFVDDIYFSEYGESDYTPYTVTVNVKEKADGEYVYSFNAEKTEESSTRRTLHAGVNTRKGANGELFIDSIPQPEQKSNSSGKKSSKNSSGKDFALDIESDSDNISGAEVMGWLKDKPMSDGKLDLEKTVARGLPYKSGKSSLTVGEIKKLVANSTREKVYSKADALKVVNRMSGTWGLTQRARDEIADTIWQFLNEAPDVEYRQDMAHDIAEYIVAKVLVDSKTENPDAIEAAEKLSYLRTGIGKLLFSDEDISANNGVPIGTP